MDALVEVGASKRGERGGGEGERREWWLDARVNIDRTSEIEREER